MAKIRKSVSEESLSRTNWLFLIVGLILVLLFLLVWCSRQGESNGIPMDEPTRRWDTPGLNSEGRAPKPYDLDSDGDAELEVYPNPVTFEKIRVGSLAEVVVTVKAKNAGILLDVPRLLVTQENGFDLGGSCSSIATLPKGKSCQIEVKWAPTSLLNYKNTIELKWQNDSRSNFEKHTAKIEVSGSSTDEKDCIVCPQINDVKKEDVWAISLGGLKIKFPPGTTPGVVDDGEKLVVIPPRKIPVGLNNKVLGVIEEGTKNVLDKDGRKIGILLGDDTIVDNNDFSVKGAALPVDVAVIDAQGKKIGETKFDGTDFKVVDAKGMAIGTPRVDTSVVDYDGRQIGMIIPFGTVLDLNGKYLGLILPTGEVMGENKKTVGVLQQNGMVTNSQGEIVGAVTPSGVGVSTGCRSFESVEPDGKVKDQYGQVVGRVLLDRAIVDSELNELGAVVRQGLIINEEGMIQGFMNANGKAVDQTGTLIGCMGPDGMVKAGKVMVGGIMKKGKVIGRSGEVIGSVYPNGIVMNQAVEPVGYVRPDGYVADGSKNIIGMVVPFGTAIAEGCRLLGMIAVSGQVINKDGVSVGGITMDKTVLSPSGESLGLITPQGPVFQQGTLLGRIRLDGYIVDKNGKVVDCALKKYNPMPGLKDGVVLNDSGLPTGWTIMSGKCYSESNEFVGDVAFNGWVANPQGRLVGFVAPDGIIVSNDGSILGSYSSLAGQAVNSEGAEFARVMPDLTVLDKTGIQVLGALIPLDSVGLAFDGSVLGRVGPNGFLAANDSLQAKIFADGTIVDANGRAIGNVLPAGPVLSSLGKPVGWANASGEVLSKGTRIGQVLGNGLAMAPDGRILGRVWMPMSVLVNGSGVLGSVIPKEINADSEDLYQLAAYDKNANYIGVVSPFGVVLGTGGHLLGKSVPVGMVFDFEQRLIGWVSFLGSVIDKNGRILGNPTQNGLVLDQEGKAIGFVLQKGLVTDKNGALLGNVAPDGSVVNNSGSRVGFVTASPFVFDQQGIIGRRWPLGVAVDTYGAFMGYLNAQGFIVNKEAAQSRLALDGRVLDASYNLTGSFVPLGAAALTGSDNNVAIVAEDATVVTGTGKTLGTIVGTDYVMQNGELVAKVMTESLFVNDLVSTKNVGQVEYNSDVYRWANVRPIGSIMLTNWMADSNKKISGSIVPMGLPQSVNLAPSGSEIFNGVIMLGDKIYGGTTASGVMMNQDSIVGQVTPLTAVIDKNGLLVGVADGTGGIMNKNGAKIASQMAFGSALSDESEWVGGALKTGFVVDDYAKKIGAVSADGIVIGSKNSFKGRVLPDGSVAGVTDEKVYNSMPYIGHTVVPGVVVGYDNTILGRMTVMGDVIDATNKKIYSSLDDGAILGTETPLVGRTLPFGSAFGCQGSLGLMNENRRIINARGEDVGFVDDSGYILDRSDDQFSWNKDNKLRIVGRLVPDRLVVNNACQVIGQTTHTGEVISGSGNTVARLSLTGLQAIDAAGNVVGHVVREGPVMSLAEIVPVDMESDEEVANPSMAPYRGARYLGRTLPNGLVVNELGVVIGCADNDGSVADSEGKVLGKVVSRGPVYGGSNTANAGKMIGRVDAKGRVVDAHNSVIGIADGNGMVYQESGEKLGIVIPLDNIRFTKSDGTLDSYMDFSLMKRNRDGKPLYRYEPCSGAMFEPEGPQLEPEYDSTKIYLYDLEDRIIAQLINCELFTKDGKVKLGSLLSDGTIRDINNDLYGTVGADNKVYNPDGSLKGEFRGAVDLRKCGLADVTDPSKVICLSGKCFPVTPNNTIVDPVTHQEIGGYENGHWYIWDAPQAAGAETPLPPVITPPQPDPNWDQKKTVAGRRKALSERLSAKGTLKIPGPEILAKARKHQDEDWGIPKSVSTWPVDMSNMILKDKGIPAVLAHSIDSRFLDIPVTAIVERHIYAESGRNIVIPAGSRLIGSASGSATIGGAKAAKVTITWNRLVRPDGAAFIFTATSGDAQGRGGVPAYLDQQLFKKYANPFIGTLGTAIINKLVDLNETSRTYGASSSSDSSTSQTTNQTYGQQTRQMFIDNFQQIFDQMMAEANSVQPVLFVPSGTRLIAYPTEDLWLRSSKDEERALRQRGMGVPSVRPVGDNSWVKQHQQMDLNGGDDMPAEDTESETPPSTPVYTPPEPDLKNSPYTEDDILPDELLERSMNPVVPTSAKKK